MIKLIATDMDGALLNSDKELPLETVSNDENGAMKAIRSYLT